jgi:peptide/nickel transport system permease protein
VSQRGQSAQPGRADPNIVIGTAILLVVAALLVLPPLVLAQDPLAQRIGDRFQSPNPAHLLGTDALGRDVLARLAAGGVVSLLVGFLSILFGASIGFVVGVATATGPRWMERGLNAATSVLMAFPALLLALFIASLVGTGVFGLVIAIGLTNVALFARLARAETMRIQAEQFIEAARSVGGGLQTILRHHVIPNIWPPIIVALTLRASTAVLTEATLSYLGLGIPPPQPTWGGMILDGQRQLEAAPWVSLAPGIAILLTVLGLNLVGDGLRDVLDPRLRGSKSVSVEQQRAA